MYTMQDPDTASQELAKWQETYATSGNGKEETRETVKLIVRGEEKQKKLTVHNFVIKNSQTSTM